MTTFCGANPGTPKRRDTLGGIFLQLCAAILTSLTSLTTVAPLAITS